MYYHVHDVKIARNSELKKIDIKNRNCYYFDNKININVLDLGNVLLNKKSYENVLIYRTTCKMP